MIHSLSVFLGLTVVLLGGCAFMTGQALANTWRPLWQALAYCLLLGAADRFLVFALFGGPLFSLGGYLLDTIVLATIAGATWRMARARRMTLQYPWIYERAGLFGWRERIPHQP